MWYRIRREPCKVSVSVSDVRVVKVFQDTCKYVKYFARLVVQILWAFVDCDSVKAVNGLNAIPKKPKSYDHTPTPQRKLVNCKPANYWLLRLLNPKRGGSAVMRPGETASRWCAPDDFLAFSQWDEENCFSYGETPEWLWPWLAVPPVAVKDLHETVRN